MDSPILLKGKFGGLSIFSLFSLFAGGVLLVFQILLLTSSGDDQTLTGFARFAPGIVALGFLWVFVSAAFIRGKFEVYRDRIEGKKKLGPRFSVSLEEVAEVRLIGSQLALYEADKKPLLIQGSPNPRQVRGLIWMLIHFKDLVPAEVWNGFKLPARGENLFGEKEYRRLFHGEGGDIQFVDGGIVFPLPGTETSVYIPVTDTVPHLTRDEDQNSFSSQLSSGTPILHFDPNPAKLPFRALIGAVLGSNLGEKDKKDLIIELTDRGNGLLTELKEEPESGEYLDFGEWKISLLPA